MARTVFCATSSGVMTRTASSSLAFSLRTASGRNDAEAMRSQHGFVARTAARQRTGDACPRGPVRAPDLGVERLGVSALRTDVDLHQRLA